jgi:shikimate kinase/3-dehydroquinate synthase
VAKVVALAGFMGSGKSAVGEAVAARLGWRFVDLDAEVVKVAGTVISDIFAAQGEEAFRAKECDVLASVLRGAGHDEGLVLSLGGGTLESPAARELLAGRGGLVFLDADLDVAWARSQGTGRPLAQDLGTFAGLYDRRRATYEGAADWVVPVGGRSVDELTGDIADLVEAAGEQWGTLWGRRLAATKRASLVVGGPGALSFLGSRAASVRMCGARTFVVSDENVARAWGGRVLSALGGVEPEAMLVLEPGEPSKSMSNLDRCWEWLAARGARRDDVVVALGGGVIGDLGGFAAATYQRGVALWQIPTSLLAQVDSSVGGKTAINLAGGKNLVGAFYQPDLVVADPATLATLPDGEYCNGLGEVVKHALLVSADSLSWLEKRAAGVMARDPAIVAELVRASVAYKARVVEDDEREHGRRAVLNLGHTTAHALEVTSGYGRLGHGQAVALGLLVALAVSEAMLGLDPLVRQRVRSLLTGFGLPTSVSLPDAGVVWAAGTRDKKARAGSSGFVGLRSLAEPVWGMDVPQDVFAGALEVIAE